MKTKKITALAPLVTALVFCLFTNNQIYAKNVPTGAEGGVECLFINETGSTIILDLTIESVGLLPHSEYMAALKSGTMVAYGLASEAMIVLGVVGEEGEVYRVVEFKWMKDNLIVSESVIFSD